VDLQFKKLVKTKTPKVQHIEVMRSPDELSRLGDLVETLERAIAAGCFYPNESPMNCSTCPHRAACLEWGRKAPAEIIDIDQPKEEVATC